MEALPTKLTINGKDYFLEETQFSKHSEILPNWWSFRYTSFDKNELPPYVHNKECWYYLCTTEETKEEAYNDMLERVNSMILD